MGRSTNVHVLLLTDCPTRGRAFRSFEWMAGHSERIFADPENWHGGQIRMSYADAYKVALRVSVHLPPRCIAWGRQSPVEITCRADQREMGERLREISKISPVRTHLFELHTDIFH